MTSRFFSTCNQPIRTRHIARRRRTKSRFANPAETAAFNRDYGKLRDIRAYGGGATVSRSEIRAKGIDPDVYKKRAKDRYDAEIAHNDKSYRAANRQVEGYRSAR